MLTLSDNGSHSSYYRLGVRLCTPGTDSVSVGPAIVPIQVSSCPNPTNIVVIAALLGLLLQWYLYLLAPTAPPYKALVDASSVNINTTSYSAAAITSLTCLYCRDCHGCSPASTAAAAPNGTVETRVPSRKTRLHSNVPCSSGKSVMKCTKNTTPTTALLSWWW